MSQTNRNRIQRRRTKGWRMPDGAVYVGRPSRWGNPWEVDSLGFVFGPGKNWWNFDSVARARQFAVETYSEWLAYGIGAGADCLVPYPSPGELEALDERRDRILHDLEVLRGKTLACWCPEGEPCHADALFDALAETEGGSV